MCSTRANLMGRKKGLKQRRELLLKAWPNMSATHRPDFEMVRNARKQTKRSQSCNSEAYIWPYINLEDLQQRHLLLLFLNSRARNLPNKFRVADVKAAHLGEGWDTNLDIGEEISEYCCKEHFFEDSGCKGHCMLFLAKPTPIGYGKVVHGSVSKLRPNELKHATRTTEGLLALEIQTEIYRFLLKCAKLILHDIDPAEFFVASCQPEPKMSRLPGNEIWNSLSEHSLEAPYRTPYMIDLERLKMLFESRRTSAEDHLWLLREDPAYFMDSLRDWKEHSGVPKTCTCRDCDKLQLGRMLTNAFDMYVFFDDIYRKLCKMDPIEVQLRRANETKVRLSTQDENQWTAIVELVSHAMAHPIGLLNDGLPTSPRLRSRYEWTPASDKLDKGEWHMRRKGSEAEYRVDRLFFALFRADQRALHGWDRLISEIQWMLDNDTEASQYVDSWITTQFSDLALLSELDKSIDSLGPYFDTNKALAIVDRRSASVEKAINRTRTVILKLACIKYVCKSSILLEWESLNRNDFQYPADKRPTKENVEQMREAEQRLDMLWWTLEEEVKFTSKLNLEKIIESRMFSPRELHRTKPWKEPIILPSPQAAPQKQILGELDPNAGGFYQTSPTREDATPTKVIKEKVKTRGKPAAADPRAANYRGPAEQLQTPPSTPCKPPQKFKISKRAFKVMCALLPSTTSVVQQRCEIAWDELLTAFNSIGLEPEKLYGSVWIFKPMEEGIRKCDAKRSIQFHEPKEVRRGQKIPRPMVRTYGRRLKHAFGWESAEDLFECE